MMEVVSGDNWSYKTCKAPVKSSSPTNQQTTFYRPDDLSVAKPTVTGNQADMFMCYYALAPNRRGH